MWLHLCGNGRFLYGIHCWNSCETIETRHPIITANYPSGDTPHITSHTHFTLHTIPPIHREGHRASICQCTEKHYNDTHYSVRHVPPPRYPIFKGSYSSMEKPKGQDSLRQVLVATATVITKALKQQNPLPKQQGLRCNFWQKSISRGSRSLGGPVYARNCFRTVHYQSPFLVCAWQRVWEHK